MSLYKDHLPKPSPLQTCPVLTTATTLPRSMSDPLIIHHCPSKRCLIGDRVYPFMNFSFVSLTPLTSARYRVDGGGWNTISASGYANLHQAITLVSTTITEFGTFVYELEVTNAGAEVQSIFVDVTSEIILPLSYATYIDINFRPFAAAVLGDVTYISKVEYKVVGDDPVALTEIPREVFFTGTHTGAGGSPSLIDSTKNFTYSRILVGTDIIANTTDGSSGIITGASGTTITTTLSGGIDNDFDNGDAYQVKKGGSLLSVVHNFSDSLSDHGKNAYYLVVTDTNTNVSSASILVVTLS